ncbi:unnamed protein product [Amoebophrya sp. A120]|nr:unnamed protein product [Amoebophrya sp. A120]|eukprot:GSA120T00013638001.1
MPRDRSKGATSSGRDKSGDRSGGDRDRSGGDRDRSGGDRSGGDRSGGERSPRTVPPLKIVGTLSKSETKVAMNRAGGRGGGAGSSSDDLLSGAGDSDFESGGALGLAAGGGGGGDKNKSGRKKQSNGCGCCTYCCRCPMFMVLELSLAIFLMRDVYLSIKAMVDCPTVDQSVRDAMSSAGGNNFNPVQSSYQAPMQSYMASSASQQPAGTAQTSSSGGGGGAFPASAFVQEHLSSSTDGATTSMDDEDHNMKKHIEGSKEGSTSATFLQEEENERSYRRSTAAGVTQLPGQANDQSRRERDATNYAEVVEQQVDDGHGPEDLASSPHEQPSDVESQVGGVTVSSSTSSAFLSTTMSTSKSRVSAKKKITTSTRHAESKFISPGNIMSMMGMMDANGCTPFFGTLELVMACFCVIPLILSVIVLIVNALCQDSKFGCQFVFFSMLAIMVLDGTFLGPKVWPGPSYGQFGTQLTDVRTWTGVPGAMIVSFFGMYWDQKGKGKNLQVPPALPKEYPWDV